MTLPTPLNIIVLCFAVAALVVSTVVLVSTVKNDGNMSPGLRGDSAATRKLQVNSGFANIFAAASDTGLVNHIKLQNALTSNIGCNTGVTNNIRLQNALTSNTGYNTGVTNNIKLQNALTSNTRYATGLINNINLQNALTSNP
jgi:hypothetical protein